MINTTLQQVSRRARSNTVRLLALFLTLSLMAHGLFFPQEWLIFGFALAVYTFLQYSHRSLNLLTEEETVLGSTDVLFLGMFIFSVLGIAHPVKVKDGLIEALRWGIFWFIYRLGVRLSPDEKAKRILAQHLNWLAIMVACLGWFPWVSKVAGRLSSVFGYPNTTATFIGAVFLLYPGSKPIQIFLGISLLGTGSRAGVGLFLAVLMGQQLLFWFKLKRISTFIALRQKLQVRGKIRGIQRSGLWVIFLGIGTKVIQHYNRSAWDNLTTWGFSSSSWQERMVYYKDGIRLAWNARGLPQAGGWRAFPTIQHFPYWTADPHSSFIHILLNQGVFGIISMGIWIVFTLVQVWKTRVKPAQSFSEDSWSNANEVTKAEIRVLGALLFLVLHSLVDVDFSFGTLGFLFWMLFGSLQKRDGRSLVSRWIRFEFKINRKIMLILSLFLGLACGSVLVNPVLLEKEQIWNTQARLGREWAPYQSIVLWNKSLSWDQTQSIVRREQAELLIRRDTEVGLQAVEEVLHWQPFDLGAYEWAQSVVWDAAEEQRTTHPETANRLYHWVEGVPENIEGRVAILSSTDRLLWQGYQDFQPSQHIILLAQYARQRQLTQLPLRT